MDPKTWMIRDPQISARGAKYCMIEDSSSKSTDGKIRFNIGDRDAPTGTPFGASTFNGEEAKRKNIEFTLTPHQEESIQRFYEWTVPYLADNSDRIFRRTMTAAQVAECLKNPVTKKGDYKAQLRCKLDTSGTHAVRCWSPTGQRCELPADLKGYKLVPRLLLSHLWCMQKECGFVFLVTDLHLLACEHDICPFI